MSHNSHPTRSSRPPRRYSPHSRSPSHSPLPSNRWQPPANSFPPPAPATHLSPQSSTNFMAGYPPVPPPPIPVHQYAPFAQQPTYSAQQPFPRDSYHSSYPTSSNPYLGPTPSQSIHPLPSSQFLHADWPPAGIHPQQDSYPIYHSLSIEQQSLLLPQGQPSAFPQPNPSRSGLPWFPGSNVGTPDAHTHCVDAQLPPLYSQRQSIPKISVHSPALSILAHPLPSTQRFAHPREHSYSSASPAPFYPSQLSPEPLSAIHGPSRSDYPNRGSFRDAHNFTMINPTFTDYNVPVDNFMKDLLQHTIIGAEFDSSARDPPPRCHPGTRLEIIERCINFILECHGEEKLRWVVGPAGVGKSAVMQMVVEKAPDGIIFASVFLSVNGRRDGTKAILTIAYQLAVKCGPYRQFIWDAIRLDPALLQKSLSAQFNKFIVEPFIHQHLLDSPRRSLIVIDGLDESDNPDTQLKLLELITDFCISYPTSPIAWIVASRPEAHITSFFDKVEIQPAYIKEEIRIDSNEACEDVQRYLRDELNKTKRAKPSLRRQREWPPEHEFTMLASAAGGLFAYASVVVRHINDPRYRDPTTQLRHILEIIKGIPLAHSSRRGHPMAQLDALYARILSNIPDDVMINVREMLLLYSTTMFEDNFRLLCNFLGLSEDTAYGAISYLYAVMMVPDADKADDESLNYFHKSFEDFLLDSKRSGFLNKGYDNIEQLMAPTCLNIIEQVSLDSDGLASCDGIACAPFGILRGCICDNISLSWPGDERFQIDDVNLRRNLYDMSMYQLCYNFRPGSRFYDENTVSCLALATRFSFLHWDFPWFQLRDCAFDKCRLELTELGKLKEVPLRTLNYAAIFAAINLRFMSPTATNVDLSHPWNPSCCHSKLELDLDNVQQRRGWTTTFKRPEQPEPVSEDNSDALDDRADTDIALHRIKPCHKSLLSVPKGQRCHYCSRRFVRHCISNPDRLVAVFVDSTGLSYVECTFVDPDDGVSEWRYRFCHSGPPKPADV